MFGNLTGWHLLIILAVVLLLFGAPKLPGLARSVGQSMRIFRGEMKSMKDENGDDVVVDSAESTAADAPTVKPAARTAKSTTAKSTTAKPKP